MELEVSLERIGKLSLPAKILSYRQVSVTPCHIAGKRTDLATNGVRGITAGIVVVSELYHLYGFVRVMNGGLEITDVPVGRSRVNICSSSFDGALAGGELIPDGRSLLTCVGGPPI